MKIYRAQITRYRKARITLYWNIFFGVREKHLLSILTSVHTGRRGALSNDDSVVEDDAWFKKELTKKIESLFGIGIRDLLPKLN